MRLVVLPGMDGGASLSARFRGLMSEAHEADGVEYPTHEKWGYERLTEHVRAVLSASAEPTVLLAESFSGPVAIRLAATPPRHLVGVVLVGMLVGGATVVGGLILLFVNRRRCLWVRGPMFGIRSAWPFESMNASAAIVNFERICTANAKTVIRLRDGGQIEVPPDLCFRIERLEELLRFHQSDSIVEDATYVRAEWPLPSGAEVRPSSGILSGPDETVRIEDPDALRTLIHQFRATAIFREAFPPAFDLARILIGLKRSNGGLVLLGVRATGEVSGLSEEELANSKERFKKITDKLTKAKVEIGRIELDGKVALFAIFNVVPNASAELPDKSSAGIAT